MSDTYDEYFGDLEGMEASERPSGAVGVHDDTVFDHAEMFSNPKAKLKGVKLFFRYDDVVTQKGPLMLNTLVWLPNPDVQTEDKAKATSGMGVQWFQAIGMGELKKLPVARDDDTAQRVTDKVSEFCGCLVKTEIIQRKDSDFWDVRLPK